MKELIRKILKENDFEWAGEHLESIPDDPRAQALVKVLVDENDYEYSDVFGGDYEEESGTFYGMDIYTLNNGEKWVIGTMDEADDALEEYMSNYVDEVGVDAVHNIDYYVHMSETDRRLWAGDEADNYIYDLSDEDVLEQAGLEDEYEELTDRESEIDNELYDLNSEISDIKDKLLDYDGDSEELEGVLEELEMEVEALENELSDIPKDKDSLIDRAREDVRQQHYDMWYECLSYPVQCLVDEHGFYGDVDDLVDSGPVSVDWDGVVSDLVHMSDYGSISMYDGDYYEEKIDDTWYVIFRHN